MFPVRRVVKCLVLRPEQRKAKEGCCVMSKTAEGGRGKRVLATATEDGIALFLEPQYFPSSTLVPYEVAVTIVKDVPSDFRPPVFTSSGQTKLAE
ncbi:hypothetical protein Tco_1261434, partial [Tanacetum coccineum]